MATRIFCALLIALTLAAAARAASPDDTFQQLYGDQVRKLKAAPRGQGEVDFARKLLSDAKDVADDKPFQALLCNKAYDFASTHADGYAVAADAMELLAKTDPKSRGPAMDKALEMYEKRYTAAAVTQRKTVGPPYLDKLLSVASDKAGAGAIKDAGALYNKALKVADSIDRSRASEIRDAIKDLGTKQAAQKHLDELMTRLKADPTDAATAGDVIQVLLYEQNRPADAAQIAATLSDPAAKRALPLAGKDPADLSEEELTDLAEWHQAQAAKAPDAIKAVAYEQAGRCYAQFLKVHTADDAAKLKAKRTLEVVQRAQAEADAKVPHRTVDLLKLIDPSRDGVKGTWKMAGSALSGASAPGDPVASLRIRYQPPEEYDLKIEFTRVKGNECVAQILSHGGHSFLTVEGGWANTVCGIDVIDGKRADANPSTQKFPQVLKTGARATVVVEVRNRSVTVKLNGSVVTRYATNYANLSLYKAFWDIGDGQLGLGAFEGETLFHSVQLTDAGNPAKSAASAK
ncbi:MAG: DJ/PfpI family protein [Phycisphaerales bacterium]|nr:DJ/PfpI family protein [Phycisphaerales bacterium]